MNIILEILIITIIGMLGNILFKVGTEGFGTLNFSSFFTKEFLEKAFFSRYGWIIAGSLIINLASRIMTMSPLSKEKSGIVWTFSIPLTIVLLVFSGYIFFGERYTTREIVGIVFAIVGMLIMRL